MRIPGDGTTEILAAIAKLEAKVDALMSKGGSSAGGVAVVACDADLDGAHGDPTVRFTPRDWSDGDFKGHRYSECPAAFLDLLANALDYFADQKQGTDPKKAGWDRKDAARARGWAARARSGGAKTAARSAPQSRDYDFDGDASEAEAEAHHSQFDEF